MKQTKQQFGGAWTNDKLERVRKYLVAYATIMKRQNFRYAYIDAFAGTGYRTMFHAETQGELMFPELIEQEPVSFQQGSARVALETIPRFTKYIFIEKEQSHTQELEHLKSEYPDLRDDITVVTAEANEYLLKVCAQNWGKNRAVVFLDPFGMQVQWATMEAIAKTEAIDLWILFPLGVAINRLLRRDANIDPVIRTRLNGLFGETGWYESFYGTDKQEGLFGQEHTTRKIGNFKAISDYFVQRLKTIFPGVAENPLALRNSRNNPLYLLCFASANPKGSQTAVKIAQDILSR